MEMENAISEIEELFTSAEMIKPSEGFTSRFFEKLESKVKAQPYFTKYKSFKDLVNYFSYIFAIISILISLLVIIGMILYSISRKKKNITLRKVYGAGTNDIIKMYIKETFIVISIAFIIAAAVSWNYLLGWLNNYAYHISLSPLMFLSVFLCVQTLIIMITIVLVYGEANKNPIKNLHYE